MECGLERLKFQVGKERNFVIILLLVNLHNCDILVEEAEAVDYDTLLNMGTELGYQLMYSGAEIYRVEESVCRLLTAYGFQPQVFAIPNCLIVSLNTPQGHPITQMRRIPAHGTDIELLERCNALCRRLCQEVPPLDQAKSLVDALGRERRLYPGWVFLLGYAAASAFFSAFFGGDGLDSVYAGICGLAVGVWLQYMGQLLNLNSFIQTLAGAAIASLTALFLVGLTPGQNLDAITIGTLMVLVPGRALTNAMWEIMAGDIISGVNRTAEALLIAAAIALGVVVALTIGQ